MHPRIRYAILLVLLGFGVFVALFMLRPNLFPTREVWIQRMSSKYTIAQRVETYGSAAQTRWQPYFARAKLAYPPPKLALVAFKAEKQLEIYAPAQDGQWKFVRRVPILRESGGIGPKLAEGDRQVPEGFYGIESLNPNSAYHLALRVSYPSDEDRKIAQREGRTRLGGDIMIHGGEASVGCLAMGDEVAEDLFILAAQTGIENVQMVICPLDFRSASIPVDEKRPDWVGERYAQLQKFVHTLPRESS